MSDLVERVKRFLIIIHIGTTYKKVKIIKLGLSRPIAIALFPVLTFKNGIVDNNVTITSMAEKSKSKKKERKLVSEQFE